MEGAAARRKTRQRLEGARKLSRASPKEPAWRVMMPAERRSISIAVSPALRDVDTPGWLRMEYMPGAVIANMRAAADQPQQEICLFTGAETRSRAGAQLLVETHFSYRAALQEKRTRDRRVPDCGSCDALLGRAHPAARAANAVSIHYAERDAVRFGVGERGGRLRQRIWFIPCIIVRESDRIALRHGDAAISRTGKPAAQFRMIAMIHDNPLEIAPCLRVERLAETFELLRPVAHGHGNKRKFHRRLPSRTPRYVRGMRYCKNIFADSFKRNKSGALRQSQYLSTSRTNEAASKPRFHDAS